jgi:glutathione S-transferase
MRLYYAEGACSLSPHIVLRETGLDFDLERVDLRSKKTASGKDYRTINPKGYVPTLELDDGERLTEGPAIVQYIAEKAPHSGLLPDPGTMDLHRVREWLSYVSTEIHKTWSLLFIPTTSESEKARAKERLVGRLEYVDKHLQSRTFLAGEKFTVADAYLFTVASWHKGTGVDIQNQKALLAYLGKIAARPSVQAARAAERAG